MKLVAQLKSKTNNTEEDTITKQTPSMMLGEVFSDGLVSQFQNYYKKEYGRDLEEAEAEDMCLKVALFVFFKERRRRNAIPTI